MSAGPKVRQAISMQAANILQKAQLDMMATKIVLTLKALRNEAAERKRQEGHGTNTPAALAAYDAIGEIGRILSMTRDECKAARSTGAMEFPDERIQAIITEACEKITNVLLEQDR